VTEALGIDHVYLAALDLWRSETFYDLVLVGALGFRKSRFTLGAGSHLSYFNRHFGIVVRPARRTTANDPYAPGLHHLCLRVDKVEDVGQVALDLQAAGLRTTSPMLYPEYAPDYWAIYLDDPDGLRLEITNYRQERRERHDRWSEPG
jgi:catechol 2,3-dioxygenase-like lactoylglutathione lyase family enzyme